jgi:hypothetical protein
MNKFREIIEAWRIKWNPTEAQKIHAEKRLDICATCPSRKEFIQGVAFSVLCGECGCPLEAKSHSPVKGACDLGKWNEIDKELL